MKIDFNELAPTFFEGLGLDAQETQKVMIEALDQPNIPLASQLGNFLENPEVDIRLKLCATFIFGRNVQQQIDIQRVQEGIALAFSDFQFPEPPKPEVPLTTNTVQ